MMYADDKFQGVRMQWMISGFIRSGILQAESWELTLGPLQGLITPLSLGDTPRERWTEDSESHF